MWSLSKWGLHVLAVSAWASSSVCSFLPQPKNKHGRLIDYLGVCKHKPLFVIPRSSAMNWWIVKIISRSPQLPLQEGGIAKEWRAELGSPKRKWMHFFRIKIEVLNKVSFTTSLLCWRKQGAESFEGSACACMRGWEEGKSAALRKEVPSIYKSSQLFVAL